MRTGIGQHCGALFAGAVLGIDPALMRRATIKAAVYAAANILSDSFRRQKIDNASELGMFAAAR
jgi:hypothetical protein